MRDVCSEKPPFFKCTAVTATVRHFSWNLWRVTLICFHYRKRAAQTKIDFVAYFRSHICYLWTYLNSSVKQLCGVIGRLLIENLNTYILTRRHHPSYSVKNCEGNDVSSGKRFSTNSFKLLSDFYEKLRDEVRCNGASKRTFAILKPEAYLTFKSVQRA